ncbi:MAG: hypothetical protein U5O39_06090 [Gammaproteobacteria bacterium]|nr:hypothetical protein [Gammaproteobacteria bacterium]
MKPLTRDTANSRSRVTAYYDAIENRTDLPMIDRNGHGSHIASVVASSLPSVDPTSAYGGRTGSYHGVAPVRRPAGHPRVR